MFLLANVARISTIRILPTFVYLFDSVTNVVLELQAA